MKRSIRVSLAALAVAAVGAFAVADAVAQPAPPPGPASLQHMHERMQRWIEDRAAVFDARIAGLKAELKLTPDQEKLWGSFESSVRDFAALRKQRFEDMMARADKIASEENHANAAPPPPPSPLERLDMMASRLTDSGAALKKIADAGKPLYASFSDQQKRTFDLLSHDLVAMERGPHRMGPMMGPGPHGEGPMMGHGPRGPRSEMGPPPPPPHEADDDDSGDEP